MYKVLYKSKLISGEFIIETLFYSSDSRQKIIFLTLPIIYTYRVVFTNMIVEFSFCWFTWSNNRMHNFIKTKHTYGFKANGQIKCVCKQLFLNLFPYTVHVHVFCIASLSSTLILSKLRVCISSYI